MAEPGHMEEHHMVVPPQKARQGITLGHIRYVLAISLVLAVIAGLALWAIGV